MSNTRMNTNSITSTEAIVVLAVDTTTPRISFVITRQDQVLALISGDSSVHHSRTFFDNLALALRLAGLEIDQIDLFAAVTGPGSFTGLRVGLSAVKGLAETTGKPAIGIGKIDLVALSAGIAGEILVLLEAGRSEIFAGIRRLNTDGSLIQVGDDRVGLPTEIIPSILESWSPDLVLGSGLDRCIEEIEMRVKGCGRQTRIAISIDMDFNGIQLLMNDRELGAVLAAHALRLHRSGLIQPLSACYIRQSDAELNATPKESRPEQ